jgi:hypothetical protein
MKIKWTNKYSNESGYVESIDTKGGHFVNTYDYEKAKVYNTKGNATKALNKLQEIGECVNNTFELVN